MRHGDIIQVRLGVTADQSGGRLRKRAREQVQIVPAYVLASTEGQFTCVLGDTSIEDGVAGAIASAGMGLWINAAMAGDDLVPAVFFDCRWVFTKEDWVHHGLKRLGYVDDKDDRRRVAQAVFAGLDLGECQS